MAKASSLKCVQPGYFDCSRHKEDGPMNIDLTAAAKPGLVNHVDCFLSDGVEGCDRLGICLESALSDDQF